MSDKKNTIEDLRGHLFDTIQLLKEGKIEASTAKAITNAASEILKSAKTEVEFIKTLGGIGEGTGFIPLEPRKPELPAPGKNGDRED